jgi:hypothetical protein
MLGSPVHPGPMILVVSGAELPRELPGEGCSGLVGVAFVGAGEPDAGFAEAVEGDVAGCQTAADAGDLENPSKSVSVPMRSAALGGSIHVTSIVGVGTHVTAKIPMRLPRADDPGAVREGLTLLLPPRASRSRCRPVRVMRSWRGWGQTARRGSRHPRAAEAYVPRAIPTVHVDGHASAATFRSDLASTVR